MAGYDLFKGVAVVVDDQHEDQTSEISKIILEIEKEGGHVVAFDDIPSDEQIANMSGVAFFVIDWNLNPPSFQENGVAGVAVRYPRGMQAKKTRKLLLALKGQRFAPVFIFTNEDPQEVLDQLAAESKGEEGATSHIFVRSKSDVIAAGVFKTLDEWISAVPSALALKQWEKSYEAAKNALFIDFYTKDPYWPAVLWKTFEDDSIPPSAELGNLISRNLWSRMTPTGLDLSKFIPDVQREEANEPDKFRKTLGQVLEGERFITNAQLHEDSISPGDVFKNGGKYFVNVRPECDCVIRGDVGDMDLYLLKGDKVSESNLVYAWDGKYGNLRETEKECIVFDMHDGKTVSFRMNDLVIEPWSKMKEKRIGRLIPPYSTRVQQRYSAYLQRPGMARIPNAAMPVAALEKHRDEMLQQEGAQAAKVAAQHVTASGELAPQVSVATRVADALGSSPSASPGKKAGLLDLLRSLLKGRFGG